MQKMLMTANVDEVRAGPKLKFRQLDYRHQNRISVGPQTKETLLKRACVSRKLSNGQRKFVIVDEKTKKPSLHNGQRGICVRKSFIYGHGNFRDSGCKGLNPQSTTAS